MIRSGIQHPLELDDLGKPSSALDVEVLREKFNVEWDRSDHSLLMASIRATSPPMWVASIVYYTIGILMTFIPSMILEALLNEYGKESPSSSSTRSSSLDQRVLWLLALLLFLLPAVGTLFISASRLLIARVGVRMKLMIQDAIYQKALRLSASSRSQVSSGQLINLMTTDTSQIIDFTCTVLVIVIIPIAVPPVPSPPF